MLFLLAPASVLTLQGRGGLAVTLFRDSALTLVAALGVLVASLRLLRREDGTPLPRLNLANLLTLARLVSIPVFWGLFDAGELRLGLLVFGLGALTDVADGLVARHGRQRTPLGRIFDPCVDVLFNVALFLALGRRDIVPGWVLGVVAARYGLLVVGAMAITLFRRPVEIRPTILGKSAGVLTMLLLVALTLSALPGGISAAGPPAAPAGPIQRLAPLFVLMLGIVEGLTIVQVLFIGWLNLRRSPTAAGDVALRLVTLPGTPGAPAGGDVNDRDPQRIPRV